MNNTNLKECFLEYTKHVKNQTIGDYMTKKFSKLVNKLKFVLFWEKTPKVVIIHN